MQQLKMSTSLLPLLDVDMYSGKLSVVDVILDKVDDFKNYVKEQSKSYLTEALNELDTGRFIVRPVCFFSPREYNFLRDEIHFDLYMSDLNYEHIIKGVIDDDAFYEFITERYKSYDGFISFVPHSKAQFKDAINRDKERTLAAVIGYYLHKYEARFKCDLREKYSTELLEHLLESGDWEDEG